MENRTCLVTGGTSGVGRAIAKALAGKGASVVLFCRNRLRGENAAEEIKRETENSKVDLVIGDLSSVHSVSEAAEEIRSRYPSLHVLSNNAGIVSLRRSETLEGIERVFATNYVGHFVLTNRLLPLLESSAPARIVTVSGTPGLLARVRFDFDDPLAVADYLPIRAALRSALAKVMFTFELARRLEGTGVAANTFAPGLVRSRLTSRLPLALRLPLAIPQLLLPSNCRTGEYLASSPEVRGATGAFFANSRRVSFRQRHHGPEDEARLWELTERIIAQV